MSLRVRRWLRAQRRRWGWLLIDDDGIVHGQMMMLVRVRVWHPGFWLFWLNAKLNALKPRVAL